jgi:hypothetical protein
LKALVASLPVTNDITVQDFQLALSKLNNGKRIELEEA